VLEVPTEHKVFLYKPYAILSLLELSRLSTPEPTLLKEVNNLEKTLKTLQSSMKTILFLPLTHYKSIWPDEEKNLVLKWNFDRIRQKYDTDTSHERFPIEMYTGELPHCYDIPLDSISFNIVLQILFLLLFFSFSFI